MSKVKIGFVGVGGMGQCAHLRNYAMLDTCEVVAIAEVKPKLGEEVAKHYNVPSVYTSMDDMFQSEALDGIVCIQPFDMHGQILPSVIKTGLPMFTEKPIASSVEVGEALVKAVQTSKSSYMVGYHKRSDPASMYVKAEVDRLKASGELGALKYVRIIMPSGDWVRGGFGELISTDESLPGQLTKDAIPSYWNDEEYFQYFLFVNYYIHQVNFMRYILGEDYKVAYADPSGVVMSVTSDSGIAGTIEMTPYRTTMDWQESIFICFEAGWIKLDLPAPLAQNTPGRVEIFKDAEGKTPKTIVPVLPFVHAMKQQAVNFIAAINGEREIMCSAEDALKDLIVARDYMKLWKGI